jgi:6-pyruvoyltetrahydropterin/6-carboxytetrahydropterin synthase
MQPVYKIETRKENQKFSAAHMATFEDGAIERLHGHNYHVGAALSGTLDQAGMVLDVGILREWVREICATLDERFLVSLLNPMLQIEVGEEQVRIQYKNKRYAIAREDCVLLPIPNTTMEHLGWHIAEQLIERIRREPAASRLLELEVSVSETAGQSASWRVRLDTPGDFE